MDSFEIPRPLFVGIPPLLKKFFQLIIALLGCIHLTGGPYALVQAVAWGNMLVMYSQEDGLAQAAIDTFSGDKPCDMCHKIADSKREDSKKQAPGSKEGVASARVVHELFPTEEIGVKPLVATDSPIPSPLSPPSLAGLGNGAPLLPPPRSLS